MLSRSIPIVFLVGFTATSPAIIIRHDRDDAKYVALAKPFTAVGDVIGAVCTLISPEWVITAAHVAEEVSPYTSFVTFNGKDYAIDRVYIHPSYLQENLAQGRDLALLHLSEPVRGIKPLPLYEGSKETGMTVTFVGRGDTGTGETGPTKNDGKKRAAQNRLERVNEGSIFFEFDAPPKGVELEGISGPGDSGGPALAQLGGAWSIVGISSSNVGNGKGLCQYGTTEVYARVSTALAWIRGTMKSPVSNVQWTFSKAWPLNKAGETGKALIEAFSSGNAAKMEDFSQKYRSARALARRTAEERAKGYLAYFNEVGALEFKETAVTTQGKVVALLYSPKLKEYRQLSLFFDGSGGFDGYNFQPARQRKR
jgi:hypothetical protein